MGQLGAGEVRSADRLSAFLDRLAAGFRAGEKLLVQAILQERVLRPWRVRLLTGQGRLTHVSQDLVDVFFVWGGIDGCVSKGYHEPICQVLSSIYAHIFFEAHKKET